SRGRGCFQSCFHFLCLWARSRKLSRCTPPTSRPPPGPSTCAYTLPLSYRFCRLRIESGAGPSRGVCRASAQRFEHWNTTPSTAHIARAEPVVGYTEPRANAQIDVGRLENPLTAP